MDATIATGGYVATELVPPQTAAPLLAAAQHLLAEALADAESAGRLTRQQACARLQVMLSNASAFTPVAVAAELAADAATELTAGGVQRTIRVRGRAIRECMLASTEMLRLAPPLVPLYPLEPYVPQLRAAIEAAVWACLASPRLRWRTCPARPHRLVAQPSPAPTDDGGRPKALPPRQPPHWHTAEAYAALAAITAAVRSRRSGKGSVDSAAHEAYAWLHTCAMAVFARALGPPEPTVDAVVAAWPYVAAPTASGGATPLTQTQAWHLFLKHVADEHEGGAQGQQDTA